VTGEVSLAGEIRPVPHLRRRLKAAEDHGFDVLVGPARLRENEESTDVWTKVSSIAESVKAVFANRVKADS
jgi:DNA repair protein RadA/Sms